LFVTASVATLSGKRLKKPVLLQQFPSFVGQLLHAHGHNGGTWQRSGQ